MRSTQESSRCASSSNRTRGSSPSPNPGHSCTFKSTPSTSTDKFSARSIGSQIKVRPESLNMAGMRVGGERRYSLVSPLLSSCVFMGHPPKDPSGKGPGCLKPHCERELEHLYQLIFPRVWLIIRSCDPILSPSLDRILVVWARLTLHSCSRILVSQHCQRVSCWPPAVNYYRSIPLQSTSCLRLGCRFHELPWRLGYTGYFIACTLSCSKLIAKYKFGYVAYGFQKYGSQDELAKDPIKHLLEVYVKINADARHSKEMEDKVKSEAQSFFRRMEQGDINTSSLAMPLH